MKQDALKVIHPLSLYMYMYNSKCTCTYCTWIRWKLFYLPPPHRPPLPILPSPPPLPPPPLPPFPPPLLLPILTLYQPKGLKFKRFPYLLTLQLKRFDFDYQAMHRIKLNDRWPPLMKTCTCTYMYTVYVCVQYACSLTFNLLYTHAVFPSLRMTFPRLLDLNGFIDEESLDKLQEEMVSSGTCTCSCTCTCTWNYLRTTSP